MPLTIKPSNIKYKNPSTGEYENINSVAEKSSAEMVADINAAGQIKINSINSTGNSYISQIQAKGTETLNSIPNDYTNLSNDVTDLKSAITLLNNQNSIELGGIDLVPKVESYQGATKKAQTTLINHYLPITVSFPSGSPYLFAAYQKDINGNELRQSGWVTSVDVQGDAYSVFFQFKNTSDTVINESGYRAIENTLIIEYSDYDKTILGRLDNLEETAKEVDEISDAINMSQYSDEISGTWAVASSKEIKGFFSINTNYSVKVTIDNTGGALRYALEAWHDDTYISGQSWTTDTTKTYDIKTLYPGYEVNKIAIRLQNSTGSGSVDISRQNDVGVYTNAPIVEDVTNLKQSVLVPDTVYVDSTSGSDSNNGLSRSTAFATIQKAVDSGAKIILVREGTYSPFQVYGRNDVTISIDHYYDSYTVGTDENNPVVVIEGNRSSDDKGIYIRYATNITIEGFEVKNCITYGFFVVNSSNIKIMNCIAHDIYKTTKDATSFGFAFNYADADLYTCLAYNIGTETAGQKAQHCDGFNIHNTGTVNLYNCSAYNCEDDGVSHHDSCCGVIDGGEWYNCGKGGIASPTHGATVNIQNAYCHDNEEGIYAGNDLAVTQRPKILISNCVLKNNTNKDIRASDYYRLVIINCIYDTIEATNVQVFGT